ncbi:hypothetical protein Caci_1991 [Catenulispora acidiphila DSM 44928]|uniref:Uncharacterized protein n=1 Tax=Catenulispora acidiphila (strain DSM 44928 / JCM 14897 / NBRC 102108 / NRRL B-24433 / ID139908) TaxID=479433 RepID=C7QFT4_CATAD|nr:hypothetical protein [Catenulispora acidiphila]ACU70911.1 hypothetical protein Caci_1991 [Catenulispora acidiphila DSM 44928]
MSEQKSERLGIADAVERTDWTRYAGQASDVKRRGERRRHRLQAGGVLGTAFAVAGVAAAVQGLGSGVKHQGESPASKPGSSAHVTSPPSFRQRNSPIPTLSGPPSASDYPSFPATLPTKPIFIADPGTVLQSGVIGAGSVSGHPWQISYRVIPSGSAANSEPQVTEVDVSLDGKVVTFGGGEGTHVAWGGYQALDQYLQNSGLVNPMVLAMGSPAANVTSIDLRWKDGTVVQVPIRTVTGTRLASFAWNPANPPDALEQVSAAGVSKITITNDGTATWDHGPLPAPIVPATPPTVTTPTGVPNLSQTPKVTPLSSGILGEGTVSGRKWQLAYEIIPSGSAANDSNEVYCTDSAVDATTEQDGCTSSKPFGTGKVNFSYMFGHQQLPLVITSGTADPGTTSMGLEWADGSKEVNAMQQVEGVPMAAVAFDPNKPPSYLLEFGSYGEYRIPLIGSMRYTWTFNWPS